MQLKKVYIETYFGGFFVCFGNTNKKIYKERVLKLNTEKKN